MILNKMWLLDKRLSIQVLAGFAVLFLVVTAGILMRASTATGWMSVAAHGANDSPIACVLEALTGEKQKRRRVLVEHLSQRVKGVIELETGFVLQLNDGPDGKRGKPRRTEKRVRIATAGFPPFPPSLGNRWRDSHIPTARRRRYSLTNLQTTNPRGHFYWASRGDISIGP